MAEKKEKDIENEILCYFLKEWIFARKREVKWYFNSKKWFYQKSNCPFVMRWESDIAAIYQWRLITIEVKKPSEMKFFDRDAETLRLEFAEAQYRVKDPKRYLHALEQREFLDKIIEKGWVWFFASSVEQVKERLLENGINLVF